MHVFEDFWVCQNVGGTRCASFNPVVVGLRRSLALWSGSKSVQSQSNRGAMGCDCESRQDKLMRGNNAKPTSRATTMVFSVTAMMGDHQDQ